MSSRLSNGFCFMIFVFMLSGACGPEQGFGDSGDDDSAIEQQPLVGGSFTAVRPEIGRFRGCTATLFAPRYVITAAHCLNYPDYTDTTVYPGEAFTLIDATGTYQWYPVSRIHSFATNRYEFVGASGLTTDIAIIQLAEPVPAAIATPASLSSVLPKTGQQATLYGFGCSSRDETWTGGFKQFLSFTYGTSTQALCPGDSGGPATLGSASGRGAVWGVSSDYMGNGSFSTWNDVFAHVGYFKERVMQRILQWEGTHREVGFDRPGMDYKIFNLTIADAAACEDACNRDSGCRAYAYYAPTSAGAAAQCRLKWGTPDWVPNPRNTSGPVASQEYYLSRAGQDYRSLTLPAPRPELCLSECARDPICRAYSYVAGTAGAQPRCWLKRGVPAPSTNLSAVSGVNRGLETGIDRKGYDYRNFAPSAADPRLCEKACSTEADCKAYTYVPPALPGGAARCWLKSAAPTPTWNSATTSGLKRGLESDADRPGSDYRAFDTADPRPEICQATCAAESACRAFTYVPPGREGSNARCHLKSSVPAKTVSLGAVSGIKGADFF